MQILIPFAFVLSTLGLVIGIIGEPTFLVCGSILFSGALIAQSIRSRSQ